LLYRPIYQILSKIAGKPIVLFDENKDLLLKIVVFKRRTLLFDESRRLGGIFTTLATFVTKTHN
jgi:hypothetical protein